jgi:hypothetical protein
LDAADLAGKKKRQCSRLRGYCIEEEEEGGKKKSKHGKHC